jgi:hypothetical protein
MVNLGLIKVYNTVLAKENETYYATRVMENDEEITYTVEFELKTLPMDDELVDYLNHLISINEAQLTFRGTIVVIENVHSLKTTFIKHSSPQYHDLNSRVCEQLDKAANFKLSMREIAIDETGHIEKETAYMIEKKDKEVALIELEIKRDELEIERLRLYRDIELAKIREHQELDREVVLKRLEIENTKLQNERVKIENERIRLNTELEIAKLKAENEAKFHHEHSNREQERKLSQGHCHGRPENHHMSKHQINLRGKQNIDHK